jgi:transposase
MNRTTWLQERRMKKFADVLTRWEHKELSAQEAGEILGCSERQFRRWRRRYEEEGEARALPARFESRRIHKSAGVGESCGIDSLWRAGNAEDLFG